ncbi:uncharacterized protein LOC132749256 [Ruditapes philippinarum]|uniref:uncharacterized protein LOC132749256 n=1 Tax=Ruditapes philippinarum TaxID=129788 RepID=UPI00295BBAB4|nr:uncharacterized protein LOC132749256 [Ruditapes philippinarum]
MATNKPIQTSTSTKTTDGSDSRKKKCFTFTVNNQLREPFFNNSVTMEIENEKSPLIEYMEKAVNEQNGLMTKFTVTYFSGKGYFVDAINEARATYSVDKSFWQIRSELVPTKQGISSFIPENGTEVVLDLITGSCDEKKRFTFTVKNQLRAPFFNNSVTMEIEDENTPLIRYMEKAVAEQNGLMEKFTTYVSDFEQKIEAINDAIATPLVDNSSWKMRTQLGPVQTGISSFKPEDGMNVILELDDN